PRLHTTLVTLAAMDLDRAQWTAAEEKCLRALRIVENALGKDNVENLPPLNNLAVAYMNSNRPDKARAALLRVLQIREKVFGKNHSEYALTAHNLAGVYFRSKDYAKAEEYYQIALKEAQAVVGKNGDQVGQILLGYVRFLEATNRMDEARKAQEHSLEIY